MEADAQIAQTRAALEQCSRRCGADDETTDVNPLRQALDAEADRLREQRAGLVSRRADVNLQLVRKRE